MSGRERSGGDVMGCGHPLSAVVSAGEGTSYCGACAGGDVTADRLKEAMVEACWQRAQELGAVYAGAPNPREYADACYPLAVAFVDAAEARAEQLEQALRRTEGQIRADHAYTASVAGRPCSCPYCIASPLASEEPGT